MAKKWVFNALVKKNDDPIGLIAYALYKFRKDEIGKQLRAESKSEKEIADELETYHNTTLRSDSTLDDLRTKAGLIVQAIGEQAGQAMVKSQLEKLEQTERELNEKLAKYNSDIKKEKTKVRNDIIDQIKQTVDNVPPRSKKVKVWDWLKGGAAGIAAQIVIVVFISGILLLIYGNPREIAKEFATKAIDAVMATPTIPVVNNEVKKQQRIEK